MKAIKFILSLIILFITGYIIHFLIFGVSDVKAHNIAIALICPDIEKAGKNCADIKADTIENADFEARKFTFTPSEDEDKKIIVYVHKYGNAEIHEN